MYVDIFNTQNKYNIIYADPPWDYGNTKNKDGQFWAWQINIIHV